MISRLLIVPAIAASTLATAPAWAGSVTVLEDTRRVSTGYYIGDGDEEGGDSASHNAIGGLFDATVTAERPGGGFGGRASQWSNVQTTDHTFTLDAHFEAGQEVVEPESEFWQASSSSNLGLLVRFDQPVYFTFSAVASDVSAFNPQEPTYLDERSAVANAFGISTWDFEDGGASYALGPFDISTSGVVPAGTYSIGTFFDIELLRETRNNGQTSMDFKVTATTIPSPAAAGMGLALSAAALLRRRR